MTQTIRAKRRPLVYNEAETIKTHWRVMVAINDVVLETDLWAANTHTSRDPIFRLCHTINRHIENQIRDRTHPK